MVPIDNVYVFGLMYFRWFLSVLASWALPDDGQGKMVYFQSLPLVLLLVIRPIWA